MTRYGQAWAWGLAQHWPALARLMAGTGITDEQVPRSVLLRFMPIEAQPGSGRLVGRKISFAGAFAACLNASMMDGASAATS